ncbi:hypothetical protein F5Y03DRAFT_392557 [Xylaria venustula]|nr:hypothetical protein F5Y03DRAFT_392557 [Xylaria venustula]
MAKERSTKRWTSRKPEKKASDDKVTKLGKTKKKYAAPPSDTSDDGSDGGVSVDVESPEDTSIIESTKSKEVKPEGKDKDKKGKRAKVTAEAEDDSAEGGAMLFSIDTNPTPVNLTNVKTQATEEEPAGGEEGFLRPGLTKIKPPSGLNRQARRRIKLIEKEREKIKKKLRIPDVCSEKQERRVQRRVDIYTAGLEKKLEERKKRKAVKNAKDRARFQAKRGKTKTARALKEGEKAGISQSTL